MLKWLWLSALVIVLDQITKLMVSDTLQLFESIEVLPFLDIALMHNTGAAFSFLSDASGWQRWFFIVLALAVSAAILVWMKRLPVGDKLMAVALALILGGALGNVWDRILLGYVIDFIYFNYQGWYWPAFNVADSAITVGAVLLIVDTLWGSRRSRV